MNEPTKMDELQTAKKAVQSCLDSASTSVDFHGLAYWAERVEILRAEIQNSL